MYLKTIKINNFRKIDCAECNFNSSLNLIVGPNDSGKTAVVDAIRFLLRQVVDDFVRISPDDFRNPKKDILLEALFLFDDCRKADCSVDEERLKAEAAIFAEYLSFPKPDFPELNVWYTIKNTESDIKFPEFKVGPNKETAVEMDARCREHLKVVYLRPLRDAENELKAKQGSRISKILKSHKDIVKAEPELIKLLKDFKDNAENFFDSGKGIGIKTEVKRLLGNFDEQCGGTVKDIKLGPTDTPNNCIKTLERLSLYYNELQKPGLGTLNMISVAAELLHLTTQPALRLILVEEIEAHLHPQRQLKIIKALQQEADARGIQMILTTHSPNLSSVLPIEKLNLCANGQMFPLMKGYTQLDADNYAYLGRFLDVTKANLFFAQGVILVEGPTEQLLIPEFSRILGWNLSDYGISVISTNGLGFDNFVNIFKRRNAPYNQTPVIAITDADSRTESDIAKYSSELSDLSNNVYCSVGAQLYDEKQLNGDESARTTLEKLIFKNTSALKGLYIAAYNARAKRKDPAKSEMTFETLYTKMSREKAPLAQMVAEKLANLKDKELESVKNEIVINLKYIQEGIRYVLPKTIHTSPEVTAGVKTK